jgi:Arc/MetJ-type ribon-helix-helix transcriptional regulator
MGKTKIAITLSEKTVDYLDDLVRKRRFRNRSQAIQEAVDEKLDRLGRRRLAEECSKLDPRVEKELAEEGIGAEHPQWPEY